MSRLFFGLEIAAPWEEIEENGRIIKEESRHMTIAFLGDVDFSYFAPFLGTVPLPSFQLGLVGICDHLLFLPEKRSRVVAGHVTWLSKSDAFLEFYAEFLLWLEGLKIKVDKREFLPHITFARRPFDKEKWEKGFQPLPLFTTAFVLYQSDGNLTYTPLWRFPFKHPFSEIEHTADIAFNILGARVEEIHLHAAVALAFKFPPMIQLLENHRYLQQLDDVIIDLNHLIHQADAKWGCPFKAVSFHGNIIQREGLLTWEMIIDV